MSEIKKFSYAILIILCMGVLASCGKSSKIEEDVKLIHKVLPLELGYGITMESIEYADDLVTIGYSVSENSSVPFEQMLQAKNDYLVDTVLDEMAKYPNTDLDALLADCRDSSTSIRFCFRNFDEQHFEVDVLPDKI